MQHLAAECPYCDFCVCRARLFFPRRGMRSLLQRNKKERERRWRERDSERERREKGSTSRASCFARTREFAAASGASILTNMSRICLVEKRRRGYRGFHVVAKTAASSNSPNCLEGASASETGMGCTADPGYLSLQTMTALEADWCHCFAAEIPSSSMSLHLSLNGSLPGCGRRLCLFLRCGIGGCSPQHLSH